MAEASRLGLGRFRSPRSCLAAWLIVCTHATGALGTYAHGTGQWTYYLLKDNFSIAGTGNSDGSVINQLDYTATGDFSNAPITYIDGDCDRDTDVDLTDFMAFQACFNGPNQPPGPQCTADVDFDDDGDVDLGDFMTFQACFNGPNQPPAQAWCTHTIGAPAPPASGTFAMQGRPVDTLSDGKVLQNHDARVYDGQNGRWLQRDPSGYVDGANLYEAFGSNSPANVDPDGRWTKVACGWHNGDEVVYQRYLWKWSRSPWVTFPVGRYYCYEGQKLVLFDDPLEKYATAVPLEAVQAWARGVHSEQDYRDWAAKYGTRIDRRTGQVVERSLGEELGQWTEDLIAARRINVDFLDPLVFFGGSAFTTLTGESSPGLIVDESHTANRREYVLAVGTTALQVAPVAGPAAKGAGAALSRAVPALSKLEGAYQQVVIFLYDARSGEVVLGSGLSPGVVRAHTVLPSRLVVGGGRALGFPPGIAGDVSLNIAGAAKPNVVGTIGAAPFRSGTFGQVFFERVPFSSFTGSNIGALGESARVLQQGGKIVIETGVRAPVPEVVGGLRAAGFVNIYVEEVTEAAGGTFLRITAVR